MREARRNAASSASRRTSRHGFKVSPSRMRSSLLTVHGKLLGNLFELEDLGTREIKGICCPGARLDSIAAELGGRSI